MQLNTFLAVALAAIPLTSAAVVHPLVGRQDVGSNGDLVSVRDVGVDANTTVITSPSQPLELVPLRNVRQGNAKRDRKAALALKSDETLYWGGQDGTVAKLDIQMPSANESIVNMERLDGMVEKIHCPRNSTGRLKVRFNNQTDFDDAQDVWQWVNNATENHFVMVIGAGDCGWNSTQRHVYHVTGLVYNDEKNTAVFDVEQKTWKEAIHTYDLTVGKAAKQGAVTQKLKRGLFDKIGDWFKDAADDVKDFVTGAANDVVDAVGNAADAVKDAAGSAVDIVDSILNPTLNPDFTIPFGSDLSGKGIAFKMNGVEVSGTCSQCTTTGAFDIEAKFSVKFFKIQEAWVEASTQGINATAIISLALKGDLTDKLASKEVPVFKISPAGISIPGVLTIGPTVSINLGAEISQIKGGVTISLGGTATIPPSTARLDFLSQSDTAATGWKPTFQEAPFKADVFVEAKASVYLSAAVGIEISVVGE